MTKGTAPSLSTSYDPATNRQTGESADANGNICSGWWSCTNGYTYDVENRIIFVGGSQSTPPTSAYSYAPGNKRVWRGNWNGFTQTVDEVTFWGANGQKLATYALSMNYNQFVATATGTDYYFGGKLIKNASGYLTPDRLGSIGKYFPYGQERPSATTDGKEKFATYFRDSETGLDYANSRYHQPGMGRFMTADPYRASAGPRDPGSWNRYAYTRGDPVNRTDPSGLDDCGDDPYSCTVNGGGAGVYISGGGVCEPSGNGCLPGQDPAFCYYNPNDNACYTPPAGGGGGFAPAYKPRPECDMSNDGNARVINFVKAHQADAETLAEITGLSADLFLAWSAQESYWGTAQAPTRNNNFFGLTVSVPKDTGRAGDRGNSTGGWGGTPCATLGSNWFRGFACFEGDGFVQSGLGAMLAHGGAYLSAALAAQQNGGTIADIANAIAGAGFNSEFAAGVYGQRVGDTAQSISRRRGCP